MSLFNNINDQRQLNDLERESQNTLTNLLDLRVGLSREIRDQLDLLEQHYVIDSTLLEQKRLGRILTQQENQDIIDRLKTKREAILLQDQELKKQKEQLQTTINLNKTLTYGIGEYWKYLMEADRSMKQVILDLGLTGERANMVRDVLSSSAIEAGRLGMNVKELSELYNDYLNTVGRVVSLNKEQVVALSEIYAGTGLARSEATKLAAQFELIGRDAISANKQIGGIIEISERMGVNATNVLKTVSANFEKLQTYTFRNGSEGMARIAGHSEKFRVDMVTALGAAENARKLEGAIDMASKLQVLGGEFSKLADPLELLYESRNDLESFNKRISDMTKGMVTLNNTASGFEFQLASPMARDILTQAGSALGFSVEQMTEMAIQSKKMSDSLDLLKFSGFNKEQRELISSMSQLNNDTGDYFVMIGNKKRDLRSLSMDELNLLEAQQKTLRQRGIDAQTFDQQYGIFMEQLKSIGLPLLEGINVVLGYISSTMDTVTSLFSGFQDSTKDIMKIAGVGVGIVAALLSVKPILSLAIGTFKGIASIPMKGFEGLFGGKSGGGMFSSASAKGISNFGIAIAGVGAGIGLAAHGISSLADSFSNLDKDQIEGFNTALTTFGLTMFGIVTTIGLLSPLIAKAGTALLPFGGAIGLIGAGIGIASMGIGYMVDKVNEIKDDTVKNLFGVAGGISAIMASVSMGSLTNILSGGAFNMVALATSINSMAKSGQDFKMIGDAFEKINVVLSGSKDDFKEIQKTVENISKADFSNTSKISELTNLLKNPLKVEFANKELAFIANVKLNIDGKALFEELNIARKVEIRQKDIQTGYASAKT